MIATNIYRGPQSNKYNPDLFDPKEYPNLNAPGDVDKVDIYYSLTIYSKEAVWESKDLSNDTISDEIYREFKEDRKIDYKNRQTAADTLVSHFAYVFDFNYKYSLQIIYINNYIEKIYKRHKFNDKKTMERYNEIFNIATEYVKKKIN